MDTFVIAEKSQLFVKEFWGQTFSLDEAISKAQTFVNCAKREVYIWNVESVEANQKPIQVIRPFVDRSIAPVGPYPLRAGHYFLLHVNHAFRDARILAILGDEALIEYTMPNGTTTLNILNVVDFTGQKREKVIGPGKSIAYRSVPIRWLKTIVEDGYEWEGNPQTKRGKYADVPSAEDLLRHKNKRKA